LRVIALVVICLFDRWDGSDPFNVGCNNWISNSKAKIRSANQVVGKNEVSSGVVVTQQKLLAAKLSRDETNDRILPQLFFKKTNRNQHFSHITRQQTVSTGRTFCNLPRVSGSLSSSLTQVFFSECGNMSLTILYASLAAKDAIWSTLARSFGAVGSNERLALCVSAK
jgi:hypothetical protein